MALDGIEYVDLLAMVEADGAALRKISPTEYAGPCPKCGGVDRLHVLIKSRSGKSMWFCRNCHPDVSDAGDYVRMIRGRTAWADVFADLRHYGLPDNGRGGRLDQVEPRSRSTPAVVRSAAGLVLTPDGALTSPPAVQWQESVDVLLWGEPGVFHLLRNDVDRGAAVARDYLYRRRHLLPATVYKFALGMLPAATTTGPMGWHAAAAGAIVMPWTFDGQYWKVQYRAIGDVPKDQRYRQKKGADVRGALPPFNGDAITDVTRCVLVVEGELDAMLGQQCAPEGVAVVTWGSASIAPSGWAEEMLEGRRVLLIFDADAAGQQAAERWEVLGRRVLLPAGKDIGDYVDLHGVDALRQWLREVTA